MSGRKLIEQTWNMSKHVPFSLKTSRGVTGRSASCLFCFFNFKLSFVKMQNLKNTTIFKAYMLAYFTTE